MTIQINKLTLLWLLALAVVIVSCKQEEPTPPEPEVIVVHDTISVTDTIVVPDTVVVPDTIVVPDTVPEEHRVLNCVLPAYLKAGDTVAIISPSYITPMTTMQNAANVLRGWGLVPLIGPNADKSYAGKYAGTPEQRASDIRWAVNHPNVKAIICSRGGYGTIQLINDLSIEEITASPKWIVGYSDISTLLGLWNCAGVMGMHGTMATMFASGGTSMTITLMRDLLFGKVPRYVLPVHGQNIQGHAEGMLVGGNVCTFAPNVGTQADATRYDSLILFVEEVGESMHNVDRQMRILQLNGVLDRCKGVILGDFAGCGSEFSYSSCEAMLHEMLAPYHIPLLCGFPAGHGSVNLPLVMGAHVTMDVRGTGSTVQFDIEGEQQEVRTANIAASPELSQEALMRLAGKIP